MAAKEAFPLPGPVPLSAAVRWGDLLFVSGQAPVDPATMELVSPEAEPQCRAVLAALAAVAEKAGSGLDHALAIDCFLADPADFGTWNRVYAEMVPAPYPARTTVVSGFVVPGMRVEASAVFGIPG